MTGMAAKRQEKNGKNFGDRLIKKDRNLQIDGRISCLLGTGIRYSANTRIITKMIRLKIPRYSFHGLLKNGVDLKKM